MSKIGFGFPPEIAYFSPYDGSLGVAPTAEQGSSMVWLDTKVASSSTELNFTTGLSSAYTNYVFFINRLAVSTAAGIWLRVSLNGGSTWSAAATGYGYVVEGKNTAGTALSQISGAGDTKIVLQSSTNGVSSAGSLRGAIEIDSVSEIGIKYVRIRNTYLEATTIAQAYSVGGGNYNFVTDPINGIQFLTSTGNFVSGSIDLYGIKLP